MWQRPSSGGSGGATVVSGEMQITLGNHYQNVVNLGFHPDVLFVQTYGGTGNNDYHCDFHYFKDSVGNPTDTKYSYLYYQKNLDGSTSGGRLTFGFPSSSSSRLLQGYIESIDSNGFIFGKYADTANYKDSNIRYTAIKYN